MQFWHREIRRMAAHHGPRSGKFAAVLSVLGLIAATTVFSTSTLSTSTASAAQIEFDLPPAIECRDVTPPDFQAAHPDLKVVEGKLRISARVISGAENEIVDFLYTIASPEHTMRFQDYLPNTMLESAVAEDQIEITDASEKTSATGADVHVVYKLFSIGANHAQGSKKSEGSRYKQIASKELVLASGTTDREHGVFFRLRPSRSASLEGAKEFTFLATVSKSWRGDLCLISCVARTKKSSYFSNTVAPAGEILTQVGVHLSGDGEAAKLAGQLRQMEEARAAAFAAHQAHENVFDTISNQTVGLFTGKKSKTSTKQQLDEANQALADVQQRLQQLAK
jgi:hypothetical protein